MSKFFTRLLCVLSLLSVSLPGFSQTLQPFTDCPGVKVVVSRPGTNATVAPYQIYLIDQNTGAITPSGDPINLQINGFGLNNVDGFLYAIHESSNVTNPFFTRVGKNGAHEDLGILLPPPATAPSVGIINTAGGTVDDQGNFYFTAIMMNLQNTSEAPHFFSGKIYKVATLTAGNNPIPVVYSEISLGNCAADLAPMLMNPQSGAFQDFAMSPTNGQMYTFIPATRKMARYNPNMTFELICMDPVVPNPATADLAGCFFDNNGNLFILTVDGKFYKGSIGTGEVTLVTQTSLPLIDGSLRGDMASCIGVKPPAPPPPPAPTKFDNCPGASVIVTKPGTNASTEPYQIYTVDPPTGNITATGSPIKLQINGFGLNSKDGFLYAIHESSNVTDPFFTRVGKNGSTVDLGKLTAPAATLPLQGIINTAGGTMDGSDHFYFTAVVADPAHFAATAKLYLGRIDKVSTLIPGSTITIHYEQVGLGNCMTEFALQFTNPGNGLLQDFAYEPDTKRIYTYIPAQAGSPASGKIAWFRVKDPSMMRCVQTEHPNPKLADLAGMFFGPNKSLYLLTTDGKYYSANIANGQIKLVTETQLPLINGNLRGDMASCVKGKKHIVDGDHDDEDDDDHGEDNGDNGDHNHYCHIYVSPNPAPGRDVICSVETDQRVQVEMIVIDSYSRIAQRKLVSLFQGKNQFSVDISQMPRGFSSITLVFPDGRRESIKFIRM